MKVGTWNNYIEYLKDWANQHSDEMCEGMSPACYEEFLDNEYEEGNITGEELSEHHS